jgi:nucleotide-binding universal stress UspA family protein
MYQKILLPLDLEESSSWEQALPTALDLRAASDGELHVLSVVPVIALSVVASYFPADYEEAMAESARARLSKLVSASVPAEVSVTEHVAKGPVYDTILKTADKIDADLIVMASHRPELKDYLIGPNAARVVRHSKRSVLVVR